MTLADYQALKSGLEEIAALSIEIEEKSRDLEIAKRRIENERPRLENLERQVKRLQDDDSNKILLTQKKQAFRSKFPGESAQEENVEQMRKNWFEKEQAEISRLKRPEVQPIIGQVFLIVLILTLSAVGLAPKNDLMQSNCTNGEQILTLNFRDGIEQCQDGSDEGPESYSLVSEEELAEAILQYDMRVVRDGTYTFLVISLLVVLLFDLGNDGTARKVNIGVMLQRKAQSKYEKDRMVIIQDYAEKTKQVRELSDAYTLLKRDSERLNNREYELKQKTSGISALESTVSTLPGEIAEAEERLDAVSASISEYIP